MEINQKWCPCGGVILADTEDWETPVCDEHYDALGEPRKEPKGVPIELLCLRIELDMARKILARVAELGPEQGEKHDDVMCLFCDMGDAGYSSRGDGFHDDDCAIKDAQVFLRDYNENS